MQEFKAESLTPIELTPMLDRRYGHGLCETEEGVLVVAGVNFYNKWIARCETYSTRKRRWRAIPTMLVAKDAPALSVLDKEVFCFGGWQNGRGHLKTIECLELGRAEKGWNKMEYELPSKDNHFSAAVVQRRVVLFGGENNNTDIRFRPGHLFPLISKISHDTLMNGSTFKVVRGRLYASTRKMQFKLQEPHGWRDLD